MKNKVLSWVLSLVMALTIFSIPVGAFAEENADGTVEGTVTEENIDGTVGDENIDGTVEEENADGVAAEENADAVVKAKDANATVKKESSEGVVQAQGTEDGDEGDVESSVALATVNDDGDYSFLGEEVNISDLSDSNVIHVMQKTEWGEWTSSPDAYKIVVHNSNPSVAGIHYYDENWEEVTSYDETITFNRQVYHEEEYGDYYEITSDFNLVPKKEGYVDLLVEVSEDEIGDPKSVSLRVYISADDVPQYRLAKVTYGDDENTYVPYGEEVNYNDMIPDGESQATMVLCSKEGDEWYACWDAAKLVWTNHTPAIAEIGYTKANGDTDEEIYSSDETIVLEEPDEDNDIEPEFHINFKQAGTADLSLDVYDDSDPETPIATIPIKITITATVLDKIKFSGYLNNEDYYLEYADYDDLEGWGVLPEITDYNADLDPWEYKIKKTDVTNMTITAKVGTNTYTAKPKYSSVDGWYEFNFKFAKVALGTTVTLTYKMGAYTRTEKARVTKYVTPKITYKNQIYNGKYLKPKVTVKVGTKTLKAGTDYKYDGVGKKNVGTNSFDIYSDRWVTPNSNYRMYETKYYRVNPRGTTLKSLAKAKKAITVKWYKQSKRMSTSRITGYQIQLATNKAFTKNKKLVTVKGYANVSKKVTKLKKKTGYYVRIRTYKVVNKKTYYSTWSKYKYIKTK